MFYLIYVHKCPGRLSDIWTFYCKYVYSNLVRRSVTSTCKSIVSLDITDIVEFPFTSSSTLIIILPMIDDWSNSPTRRRRGLSPTRYYR